jgi:hypothetical protein
VGLNNGVFAGEGSKSSSAMRKFAPRELKNAIEVHCYRVAPSCVYSIAGDMITADLPQNKAPEADPHVYAGQ